MIFSVCKLQKPACNWRMLRCNRQTQLSCCTRVIAQLSFNCGNHLKYQQWLSFASQRRHHYCLWHFIMCTLHHARKIQTLNHKRITRVNIGVCLRLNLFYGIKLAVCRKFHRNERLLKICGKLHSSRYEVTIFAVAPASDDFSHLKCYIPMAHFKRNRKTHINVS